MSDSPAVSHLTAHLGFWLRLVSNHVSHAFARKLHGAGVTVAEWVLLRELYQEARIGPSRLAERMGMTRGAISKLADRLVAKDLLEREDRADDARSHWLACRDRRTRGGRAKAARAGRDCGDRRSRPPAGLSR